MTEAKHTPTFELHDQGEDAVTHRFSLMRDDKVHALFDVGSVSGNRRDDRALAEQLVQGLNAYTAAPEPPAHGDAVVERVAKAINAVLEEPYGIILSPDARMVARAAIAAMPAQSPLLNEAAEVLRELRLTSRLLLQNSVGCATNHYGHDHELLGLPGWLADSQAVIERAEALLSKLEGGK